MEVMRALVRPIVHLAFVLTALVADAQTIYVCGRGSIVDVQYVAQSSPIVMVRTKRSEFRAPGVWFDTTPHSPTASGYFVTADFDGDLYTGHASADDEWNLAPAEFRADQVVDVCVNGTTMILDRLDGQDFRARVVRVLHGKKTPARH